MTDTSEAMWMVREFHRASGHPQGLHFDPLRQLRSILIMEECAEAADAIMGRKNWHGRHAEPPAAGPMARSAVAKELADVLVVAYGAADVFHIPLDVVLVQVHESNMTKDFAAPHRADGKILKGDSYQPPELGWLD